MTSGAFQQTGLSVHVHRPLSFSVAGFIREVTDQVATYAHVIGVDGGFVSCDISLVSPLFDFDDWIESGLGRHIVVYGPDGIVVWEGFVDQIEFVMGNHTMTTGPLMEMANRVSVEYTPYIDITVDPATTGEATVTVIVEDTDSQAKYGIIEKMFSSGTLIDDSTVGGGGANEAEQIRDAYLADLKDPQINHEHSPGGSSDELSIKLSCRGYFAWLENYIYDNPFSATITIPAKIIAILAADPNGIISGDTSHISDEAEFLLLTPDGEDGLRSAKEVIDEMVEQGTANDDRTFFGVYEGRTAYFQKTPTSVEYKFIMSDNRQVVEYMGGAFEGEVIPPYALRPGKWLFYADFLPGRQLATAAEGFRTDKRVQFIEEVTFTAPYSFELRGVRQSKLPQLLKKVNFIL